MKCFIVVLVFICVYAEDVYKTKYDNINLDEVLLNERLYRSYLDCLTEKGRCSPEGKTLKEYLPDAIKTGCAKCTEKQRKGVDKVFKYLIEKKPEDWARLEQLYDPDGTYRTMYNDKFGITSK